ncbi:sensor histidine kinase [Geomonas terrae]|uniref:Sensor histidine kinase n=1 Tax=Geomonas terrae TaxID=2562681 RepID=A0A4S1CAJ0_9BACT|nr:sensor histidine kinase [Geomonas terrae]TGU70315.1 sensor histidine kinase [Geomonas terrae]
MPDDTSSKKRKDTFTHYAPAFRQSADELVWDIEEVVNSPLVSGLMSIANGLFAVLNKHRQVVALNDEFLKLMGIDDPKLAIGLRPGEYVACVHSCETAGGCGTSKYCSTCGAAISIMTAIDTLQPQERTCAITVDRDHKQADIYFNVRSCPIFVNEKVYILLFMQDITLQQSKECLDRAFFHDINNILCGLLGKSELLALESTSQSNRVTELHRIVIRIAQEIAIQDSLTKAINSAYKPLYTDECLNDFLHEIEQIFSDHPLTASKRLEIIYCSDAITITSDFSLLTRVVVNMITNALEAISHEDKVTLWTTPHQNAISFNVWNPGTIPQEVAQRIFQRNFSTKGNIGRGMGTYSMKLFGEQILGGSVEFITSASDGTTFTYTLPMSPLE